MYHFLYLKLLFPYLSCIVSFNLMNSIDLNKMESVENMSIKFNINNHTLSKTVYLELFIILIVLACICSGCSANRPRVKLISTILSPDGKHSINIYFNRFGATVDDSITATIIDHERSKEWNIFFHYHLHDTPEHIWLTNDTVMIEGHKLNIYKDYYETFEYPYPLQQ